MQVLVHGRASVKNMDVVGRHRQNRKGSRESGQTTISARVIVLFLFVYCLSVCLHNLFYLYSFFSS